MPKLWVLNVEETQGDNSIKRVGQDIPKYLWCLSEDDVAVVPVDVDQNFLEYISTIKGFKNPCRVFVSSPEKDGDSLARTILDDFILVNKLQELTANGSWFIESYIYTEDIVTLSRKLNVSCEYDVDPELVKRINFKSCFKLYCQKCEVQTPEYVVAVDLAEIKTGINKVCKSDKDLAILKWDQSAGGYGHILGTRIQLLADVKKKENEIGNVMVIERFEDFSFVLGSLIKISATGLEFVGIDKQVVEGNSWQGLEYPFDSPDICEKVKKDSMLLAQMFQEIGVIGFLNLDFGVKIFGAMFDVFCLEANLRHNGMSLMIDAFGVQNRYLYYYSGYKNNKQNFAEIFHTISSIKNDNGSVLAKNINAIEGVVVVNVTDTKVGLLLFGPSIEYINATKLKLAERLL